MAKKNKPVPVTLTPEALAAIKAVVGYSWYDEQKDYHECLSDAGGNSTDGHVFEHLKLLNDELKLGF